MKQRWCVTDLRRGQILMEAIWLVLFSCAFLAMLSHLYEKGKKEIKSSRFLYMQEGKHRSNYYKELNRSGLKMVDLKAWATQEKRQKSYGKIIPEGYKPTGLYFSVPPWLFPRANK